MPPSAASLWLLVTLAACSLGAQSREPVSLQAIVLSDVQGLFGGQDLWALRDGTAFVQFAGHSPDHGELWSSRYRFRVTASQWKEVERLVGVHKFATIKTPQRPGVPDEARPDITLLTQSGTRVTISKWANDKVPDFDAVYNYLLELTQAGRKGGELIGEQRYDWEWRPDGFGK